VFGVRDPRALGNANDLGIAMQLTNICRDVEEDFRRNRLYLPAHLLRAAGAPELAPPTGDLARARPALARVVRELLALADRYYASGDAGIPALPFRVALAVRSARLVYAAIGREIAKRNHDVLAGRAVVPWFRKLGLVLRAVGGELVSRLRRRIAPPERGASHAL
jgi:phytoene synthase